MFAFVAVLLAHFSSTSLLHVRADDVGGQLTSANDQSLLDFDRLRHLLEALDFHLQDYQSAGSPGKRSEEADFGLPDHQITSDELRAANAVLEGLVEQRQAIATLSRLLVAMRADMNNIRNTKRDCRFRLGGHCLTESLDRVASNYYYLKSPHSPGRRRRQVEMTDRTQEVY